MKNLILSILIAAAAVLPANALSKSAWEARFFRGLLQRNYSDLAGKVLAGIEAMPGEPAEKAAACVEVARGYIEAAEAAASQPLEVQQEYLAIADKQLKSATTVSPEIVKDLAYMIEAANLGQRRASILASRIAQLPDADKEKVFRETDAMFIEVEKQWEKTIVLARNVADKAYQTPGKTESELADIIDEALMKVAEYELREALCHYAHIELYDHKPNDPKRRTLVEATLLKLAQVIYASEDSSLCLYAYYYSGKIYKKDKNWPKAVEFFKKALEVPRQIQIAEVINLTRFEYSDVLAKDEKFKDAIDVLTPLIPKVKPGAIDLQARAMLQQATAKFAWAADLRSKSGGGPPPAAMMQQYQEAITMCQAVIAANPKWEGTAQAIIAEWSSKITDSEDPTVLLSEGSRLYRDRKYKDAAKVYQKVLANVKVNDKYRTQGGFFLAMSYYHSGMFYEAALVSDYLATRFDPEKQSYAQKAIVLSISSSKKQFDATKSKFDRRLYLRLCERIGEEASSIIEAQELAGKGKYDDALKMLAAIKPTSKVYDQVLFNTAQIVDARSGEFFKQRENIRGWHERIKALELYKSFIDWAAANPPKGDRQRLRQDNECRAIQRLGSLLLDAKMESYLRKNVAAAGRDKGQLEEAVKLAARAMCQKPPKRAPANADEANAQITVITGAAQKAFLKISADIRSRYTEAPDLHPYIVMLRIVAAGRVGNAESAAADVTQLKDFPEFQGTADAFGRVAIIFDTRARQLDGELEQLEKQRENEKKPELDEQIVKARAASEEAYSKALAFFVEMLGIDPTLETIDEKQRFDMFHYVILLQYRRGVEISVDDKIQLINTFLEQSADENAADKVEKIEGIRLILAEYLTKTNKLDDARQVFEELSARYEKDFEERRKKDPRAPTYARHWQVRHGLASTLKALGLYEDSLRDFNLIWRSVPAGSDTWWRASYEMYTCWMEMKAYDKAVNFIRTIHQTRPTLGGRDMKNNFLMLLTRIQSLPDDQLVGVDHERLLTLIDDIRKETK